MNCTKADTQSDAYDGTGWSWHGSKLDMRGNNTWAWAPSTWQSSWQALWPTHGNDYSWQENEAACAFQDGSLDMTGSNKRATSSEELPWSVVDIGSREDATVEFGWINESSLRCKLGGILPAYRSRPPRPNPRALEGISRASILGDTHARPNSRHKATFHGLLANANDEVATYGPTESTDRHLPTANLEGPTAALASGPVRVTGSWARLFNDTTTHVETVTARRAWTPESRSDGPGMVRHICTDAGDTPDRLAKAKEQYDRKPGNAMLTLRRPEELARAGHVCQSRIPRPCKFMRRCRNAKDCDFCHDQEAHCEKRMAKAWMRELHVDEPTAASMEHSCTTPSTAFRGRSEKVASATNALGSLSTEVVSKEEYVGKFFPRTLDLET